MAMLKSSFLAHLGVVAALVMTLVWIFIWLQPSGAGLGSGSASKKQLFNWHPFLMVAGYIACMGEALIMFRSYGGPRPTRKRFHGILNFAAWGFATAGLVIVILYHEAIQVPHFYSAHSWVGLLVFGMTTVQLLVAIFVFGLQKASSGVRAALMPWHRVGGKFIFMGSVAAMVSGFMQKQRFDSTVEPEKFAQMHLLTNTVAIVIVLAAGCILVPMEFSLAVPPTAAKVGHAHEPNQPVATA
eukprot:GDKH01028534.1.p1 GENE.GDKH01028534.1~~GDKH01028534.1.p1  ORF type:complete len:242 (-),score=46.69 GDKH01028534.1:418-1143(-)